MSKDSVNDSELLGHLIKEFGDEISIEGVVVTDKSSKSITSGEEQFGFYIPKRLSGKISESCKLFYEGKGYDAVLRGKSVHLKRDRRVEKIVVITEASRSNGSHFEISIKLI